MFVQGLKTVNQLIAGVDAWVCLYVFVKARAGRCYQHVIYAEYTCLCAGIFVRATSSGCQLQFCGPDENTAASLRVLLVPLPYRCAGLPLCQFQCVCVSVCVLLLQEAKLIPRGLEFLIGLDVVSNSSPLVLIEISDPLVSL